MKIQIQGLTVECLLESGLDGLFNLFPIDARDHPKDRYLEIRLDFFDRRGQPQ